jgi:hypothetical protein
MEAYGPMTRRGNSLPPDSQAGFDRSGPARNSSAKPGAASTSPINPPPATGGNRASRAAGADAASCAAQRPIELPLGGRGSLLNDLVGLIGLDGASRLIAAFGGIYIYVPHTPGPDDTLSETIGHDAALRLAKIYGGDRIDVPNPPPRRTQIIELRASGVSIDVIARSLRCTRRRVFQVLAEARRKQRLRDLPQPR